MPPVNTKTTKERMKTLTFAEQFTRECSRLTWLIFVWFALSPPVKAVTPAPDGGYASENTAEGDGALFSLTSGADNTAIGSQALFGNTTGNDNTATGFKALTSNTTGSANTATGLTALEFNRSRNWNTATGEGALLNNTIGNHNTANGVGALSSNFTGSYNTATGAQALAHANGTANTATGFNALTGKAGTIVGLPGSSGNYNTADGFNALANNTGNYNTADGLNSLANNTGNYNTADGLNSLANNTSGDANTANGVSALFNNDTGSTNTAIGILALENNTTGDSNIALGFNAGKNLTTGSDNIDIGNQGIADESSAIRIGTAAVQMVTFIAGIRGTQPNHGNSVPVVIDTTGQLGTVSSSARFKDEIKPMNKASEAIMALKPVTFHYKSDKQNTPQFGLIAEEVAKVNPDLVVRDEHGEVYTVRYEAVNAMLLNEFLKAHKKLEAQQSIIERQQKQIDVLTTGLQKVSAAVELNKATPTQVADKR